MGLLARNFLNERDREKALPDIPAPPGSAPLTGGRSGEGLGGGNVGRRHQDSFGSATGGTGTGTGRPTSASAGKFSVGGYGSRLLTPGVGTATVSGPGAGGQSAGTGPGHRKSKSSIGGFGRLNLGSGIGGRRGGTGTAAEKR